MGLRNPRTRCGSCGGWIQTQKPLSSIVTGRTETVGHSCPHCGAALTGKVRWDNTAELAKSPPAPVETNVSTADELVKLAQLHESGALSDDEFKAAKARLL
jgi:predicted RNA-binding Zn-ribbon protein involved in translation (DUF1610 family)